MTKSNNATGDAFNADAVVGHDDRTDKERAAAERKIAEDTVTRLETKRDKAERHLDDAEEALAVATAQLKGDD